MAVVKRAVFGRAEIEASGRVFVKLHLEVLGDGELLTVTPLRLALEVDADIDALFARVNAGLPGMGFTPVDGAVVNQIKALAALAWTPEIKAAAAAERAEQLAAINAQSAG